MVGDPTPPIFLSFAMSPVIAFGTPRDKQTNVVPARCAATEGRRQHYPARTFTHKRTLFPLSPNDPHLVLALVIERHSAHNCLYEPCLNHAKVAMLHRFIFALFSGRPAPRPTAKAPRGEGVFTPRVGDQFEIEHGLFRRWGTMTLEKFEEGVRTLWSSVPAMTLATSVDGIPWATDVYFAADGYELVFFSSPASRHCRNLKANPACAATVHPPAASWREIKGLQMEGTAESVTGVEATAHAFLVYFAKFPFARDLMSNPLEMAKKALNVKAHVFRPERIHYLDNALGFGTRFSLRLESGKASGSPERDAGH